MNMAMIPLLVLLLSSSAFADSAKDAREPDRTCKVQADCVATCGLGAVSKAWLSANEHAFQDCNDGCTGWGQKIECIQRKCTVFDSNGKESASCNSRKYRTLIVPVER